MNHVSFLQMDVVDFFSMIRHKNLHTEVERTTNIDMERVFKMAKEGDISVLSHPKVSEWRGIYDNTPLHRLAIRGCIEVLDHKDAYVVKNSAGKTPAEYLHDSICGK